MHCHKYLSASLIITLFTYYLALNIERLMQWEAQQYSCKHAKTEDKLKYVKTQKNPKTLFYF
jgi:hypothetical protein